MVLSPNKKIEFKGAPALNIIGIGQNEKNDQSGTQEPQIKEIEGNGGTFL